MARAVAVLLALLLLGCGTEQEQHLGQVYDWAGSRLESQDFVQQATRGVAEPKPSDAVAFFFSSAHAASQPNLPPDVGIAPMEATKSWIVVLRPDDAAGEVVIESYGEDPKTPLKTRRVRWPPK